MSCLQDGLASLSTGELVQAIEAVAAELALRTPPESGTAALECAEALGTSIDLAEAALAVLVARVDTCGAHQQSGFPSTAAWLRDRLGTRHGRATERVTLARQLPRLERTAKLLAGGELPVAFASTTWSPWSAPARGFEGSRKASSSNDPTNQEVISRPRDQGGHETGRYVGMSVTGNFWVRFGCLTGGMDGIRHAGWAGR
jgi:hypothetical protein